MSLGQAALQLHSPIPPPSLQPAGASTLRLRNIPHDGHSYWSRHVTSVGLPPGGQAALLLQLAVVKLNSGLCRPLPGELFQLAFSSPLVSTGVWERPPYTLLMRKQIHEVGYKGPNSLLISQYKKIEPSWTSWIAEFYLHAKGWGMNTYTQFCFKRSLG